MTLGKEVVSVLTGGEVRRDEAVVLSKTAGMGVAVAGGSCSSVTGFVLVTMYAVVAVLCIVVLSVTTDIPETGAELDEVTIGVTAAESVVSSVVSVVV